MRNHHKAVIILTKLKKQIVRLGIPCTLDDADLLSLIKASDCNFLAVLGFIQAMNKEKGLIMTKLLGNLTTCENWHIIPLLFQTTVYAVIMITAFYFATL